MRFFGLIVTLAAGLAAASPIAETKAADECPKWDALVKLWNGFACCTYSYDNAVGCCRLPAADEHGYYPESMPCTSPWFSSLDKWIQFMNCNRDEPWDGDCEGVPIVKKA
ncbi:hypothetical protein RB597_000808 [Gaeumannomyces tritici]